jgi:hypothetical protein
MLKALQQLLESNVVSEEVKAEIEESWNQKVKENKLAVTSELREEFAKKYEHDKSTMVEAIESMLQERLEAEMSELKEDRDQLAETKAKYAIAMRENATVLRKFVTAQLAEEIKDLHEDQKLMAQNFAKLEEFIVESLAKEISEFYEDKKDLAETKVRLIREGKAHFNKVKKTFIERSAKLVAETVKSRVQSELTQLKEDIHAARKNDFGRKIFEAVAEEYQSSYLNTKSETAKLMKVLSTKDKQLGEARAFASKAKRLVESSAAEKKQIVESHMRKDTISELVSPLNTSQREIMNDLLESVQTGKLRASFEKYLPSVLNEGSNKVRQKNQLNEGVELTGNRNTTTTTIDDSSRSENVVDLRRLAGI